MPPSGAGAGALKALMKTAMHDAPVWLRFLNYSPRVD